MKQKDNHWFAHDKNAMNDPKLMSLKTVYGMKGYGIWWALMEVLRSSDGYRYNLTEEFAYTHLSRLLEEMTPDEVRKFIDDCINRFKLLKLKNGCIYHEEMTEQLRALDRKRKELKANGKKGGLARTAKTLNNNELSSGAIAGLECGLSKERTTEDRTAYNSIAHNSTAEDGGVATVVGGKTAISLIPDNTKHTSSNDTHYTLEQLLEEMTPDEVRKFIDDCINRFKLLKLKNGCIYHEEMTEQLRALDRKRKLMSDSGKKSAAKRKQTSLNNNELCNPVETTLQPPCNKERTTEDRTAYNSIAHNSTAEDGGVATVVGGKTAISLIPDNTKHTSSNDTHYTLEQLLERSMADDNFNLLTTELKKITPEQLRNWLTAFNKWLRYTAETEKTDTDYRKHFRNWLGHHDVKTENPLTYNPAADAQKPKGKYALPPAPEGISAKEALRRHKEEMERSRKIDEDLAIARGKIKPEDLGRAS